MAAQNKIASDIPPEKRQRGRPKGSVNKTTAILKDAILQAAEAAGGEGGMTGYLTLQAHKNPGPFMTLLGKVLPTQTEVTGKDGGAIETKDAGATKLASFIEAIAARSGQ